MRVRISSRRSVITWLLPSLLSLALVGCAMSEERVVARAEGLAAAGRGSDALRLLGNYLERTPQAAGPRRLKILLAIEEQQSEEALRDYEAMSASQKGDDPALLHQLSLGLIRDALRSHEGFLRARAAAALVELADPSADWLLRLGLEHPDSSVRAHAAETVGRLGNGALRPELEQLLSDLRAFFE